MAGPGRRLNDADARAVLRRAAEIDRAGDDGLPETGYELGALREAAAEVGIAPDAVQWAVAELDAGALAPTDDGHFLGPAQVSEQRFVPATAEEAAASVRTYFEQQTFAVVRQGGNRLVFERRDDLAASLRRTFDFSKQIKLEEVSRATSTVVAVEGGSLVRVTADLGPTRRGLGIGMVGGPAAAGTGAGVALGILTTDPLLTALIVPAGLGLAGVGALGGRRLLARSVGRTRQVLAGVLDDLEHDRLPRTSRRTLRLPFRLPGFH